MNSAIPATVARPPAPPPLIDLVEEDPAQARLLGQALRDSGFRVRVFSGPAAYHSAFTAPTAEHPAALVLDIFSPGDGCTGAELLAQLRSGPHRLPPVVCASASDDMPTRVAAIRAGACRYLAKPVEPGRLSDLLEELTGWPPTAPCRVLMVGRDPQSLAQQAATLRAAGMDVRTLTQPLQTIDAMDEFSPDVLVLGMAMPGASGPEVAAALRDRDRRQHPPILFLAGETETNSGPEQSPEHDPMRDDVLVTPVRAEVLVRAVAARARRARQAGAMRRRLDTVLYENQRGQLALDHHALVSVADQAGNIVHANDLFCSVSGYTRGELLGQNHRLLKSEQHPPGFYQQMWRTIAAGGVWQGELCNRRKDGTLYWVAATITPFLDDAGRPYRYVSIRTDISALKATEQRLRLGEAKLRALLDAFPGYIAAVDEELVYTHVNDRMAALLGRPAQQIIGQPVREVLGEERFHQNQRDRARARQGEPVVAERVYAAGDGQPVHLEVTYVADLLRSDGRQVRYAFGVDITARKRAEQALIGARDEAERANRAKSQFLSSMSHELRTPMNAILGFAQLLEYDVALGAEQRDSLREILKGGRHLLDLINQVLDLAAIESGKIELSMEPVQAAPMVEECLALVRTLADQRGIVLRHATATGAVVWADRTRIRQVLLNLLSNAIKYNREGGSVHVQVRRHGEAMLRILVTDTGSGIAGELLPKLFQPFNRLGVENSNIEGTGIGLAITRHIVEMMGGTVDLRTEAGVGSTFWVDLPAAHGASARARAPT